MANLTTNIDSWDKSVIDGLVGQTESITLEFKKTVSLAGTKDKKEIAKDISAMANSEGGWIIYGLEEGTLPGGLVGAINVCPLSDPNVVDRIDDIIYSTVTPRVKYRIKAINYDSGWCIAVKVEQSVDVLHMVIGYDDNRYYRRTDKGARPLSETEVRITYDAIFRRRTTAEQKVNEIIQQEEERVSPWFSAILIPLGMEDDVVNPQSIIDSGLLKNSARSRDVNRYLELIKPSSRGMEFDPDLGRMVFRIRRDGAIHIGGMNIVHEDYWHPYRVLSPILDIASIAKRLWTACGIVAPAKLAIVLRPGGKKAPYLSEHQFFPLIRSFLQTDEKFSIPVAFSDLDNPLVVARPAMDRLWNAMGEKRCILFENDGSLSPTAKEALRHF